MGDASYPERSFAFKQAWVTLLTRSSYLPGAVLLAHSLKKNQSKYPLLILITPSFPSSSIESLAKECALSNAHLIQIEPLFPPPENSPSSFIAARFEDTWTKLRVFELHKHGLEKLVFLDADMLVYQNMDELFDLELPGKDWIAANHACVCNLDGDKWAPPNWTKENCAFTGLGPESAPTLVPGATDLNGLQTHTLLNSGLFIFTPFESQWQSILKYLRTSPTVKSFLFPDQDFLAEFFKGRWLSLGWKYNALKTWRYWHPEMWRDGDVKNLHYIVDKPWSKRVGQDGKAGYLGNDGVTHGWWWEEFKNWEDRRETDGEVAILEMVRQEIAKPLGNGESVDGLHGNWQAVA